MTEMEGLCRRFGIKAVAEYGANRKPYDQLDEWQKSAHPYRVTLTRKDRDGRKLQLSTDFYCGPAHTKEPSAADVLACLVSDASACSQEFEEWASDLGMDADSRKAEATYRECRKIGEKVLKFLGDDLRRFQEASH